MTNRLLTIGDLVKRTGAPKHRVTYAIDSRQIEPADRCGLVRLWTEDQARKIELALQQLRDKRRA